MTSPTASRLPSFKSLAAASISRPRLALAQKIDAEISRHCKAGPLPYLRKIAMPSKSTAEAGCAGHAIRGQRLTGAVPFLNQTLAHAKPMALDGRPAVGTNADLRKARDLLCHCLCLRAGASLRG